MTKIPRGYFGSGWTIIIKFSQSGILNRKWSNFDRKLNFYDAGAEYIVSFQFLIMIKPGKFLKNLKNP